ncbi:hypothetical protein KDA_49060 [Dictyobacter alpinus]|uniref:Uncharacterized protein n=1 Tax=Dictyobacter alpinus TaxID=2014873 RepID=A0A402BDQ2_9CHLR|nr:hypothetical protein KDA_49060 [Dictyobacter alpinus]
MEEVGDQSGDRAQKGACQEYYGAEPDGDVQEMSRLDDGAWGFPDQIAFRIYKEREQQTDFHSRKGSFHPALEEG